MGQKINYHTYVNKNKSHQSVLKIEQANKFINEINEEKCYLLGLLWADGYVRKNGNGISLEIVTEDFNDLQNIFSEWGIYHRQRKNRKPQTQTVLNNSCIWNFLKENDYINKSLTSPNKILNIIPQKHHNHFWRGYFDGDGCIYINKCKYISFGGSYDQDWSNLINLLQSLNLKYYLYKQQKEKSQYSSIKICSKNNIKILGEYLYKNANIYLKRKYDKFNSL
jgi:intein/homing endonuclease